MNALEENWLKKHTFARVRFASFAMSSPRWRVDTIAMV